MPIKAGSVAHTLTVNVTLAATMEDGKSHAPCSTVNASKMTVKQPECAVVKVPKRIAVRCP